MTFWEYKTMEITIMALKFLRDKSVVKILNNEGDNGWELIGWEGSVSLDKYYLLFKRGKEGNPSSRRGL